LATEKITRKGLLRFFFAALTINSSAIEKYRIPDWKGSLPLTQDVSGKTLKPGEFLVAKFKALPSRLSEELEVYRIFIGQDGELEIIPRERFAQANPGFQVVEDKTLIMNLTTHAINLLR
jgi:hypothetical protein